MQELCGAIIQFFDLIIEKYINHLYNPKQEWAYFKSMLQQQELDLGRIKTYLKVLKTSHDISRESIPKLEIQKLENYVSPLREHNIPFESPKIQIQIPQIDNKANYYSNNQPNQLKRITQNIVDKMGQNNIQLALLNKYKLEQRRY
ncbi:hypothetical protein pb186bvf_013371 [Paramecium bursaria]